MSSSDSAIQSSVPKDSNSKNYGGAGLYKFISKYITKYIRNTLLTCKQTLKKLRSTLMYGNPKHLNIVSDFHT